MDSSSSDDELDFLDFLTTQPKTKIYLARKNPFDELDDDKFKERFRLSKSTVLKILEEIEDKLEYPTNRSCSISPINQLLITLRLYATGTFQLVVGDIFGVSKATACRIVHKVTAEIARLSKKYIKFPQSPNELSRVRELFFKQSGFPGVVGAIDCTHIPISSPGGDEAEAFRNRKGYFSINVQLVSDPQLIISDVVARWPGSSHDSTIFDFSHLRYLFETSGVNGLLIGDSGYPCRSYLMTPLLNPTTPGALNYNNCHVQARNCIERANGVIKRRFPALQQGLRVKLKNVPHIIVAIVVLHNIAMILGDEDPPNDIELANYYNDKCNEIYGEVECPPPPPSIPGDTGQRQALIIDYFS